MSSVIASESEITRLALPETDPVINRPFSRFVKRATDLTLALAMILFIAPWLFTLVVAAILIDSWGPPFFLQKRTGRNFRTFYCIKFRTMVLNRDSHRQQVTVNDPRITRVGRFLRHYHIDELPQVFNVLAGSMSIVGPRPHMLRHHIQFSKRSTLYSLRHAVKPGMTGLAQVRGFHGMINSDGDFYSRLNSDLEYIRNWTPGTDIAIFFRTTFQILFSKR